MLQGFVKKIFGSKNDREIKELQGIVESINSFEEEMKSKSDEDFPSLTGKFRERLIGGETLDDLLPEAYAAVREVAKRRLNMRHFDVQLMGGIVLHQGKISEMKTGEGKTLVATLPMYLNALTEKGANLVTVNDYLARRDARWMAPIYHAFGLTIGIIQHESSLIYDPGYVGNTKDLFHLRPVTRREAYNADITYGTNNEYGFDYLRDNMKFSKDEFVQRDFNFAIVDEVDSILIDEARTPLIISGPTESSTEKYYTINGIIPSLKKEVDYTVDEKGRQVLLTDDGVAAVESLLKVDNLYDPRNIDTLHHVNQALIAHTMKVLDVDYVVSDGSVVIVDEFTGRLMPGRRWGDGLHQAVEAKENVKIENENQTLATITFQNFFRMYDKLAGMTGTADTEAAEFASTYGLDVVVIPTNKDLSRNDLPDLIYKTTREKYNAVAEEVKGCSERGQPVLVGTISIEHSEQLSKVLKKAGIAHNVLNAKKHDREAEIIAQAGRLGAVTISTNMAGRGTDIVLGGNPEVMAVAKAGNDDTTPEYKAAFDEAFTECEAEKVKVLELGGLHVTGTERHESRRIDNQLRGRSGRQGDPGSTRFYLSLDDDLMRIFGSERIASIMDKLGMEDGEPIEHPFVTKAIENAQKKVEGHNFDIRKHLLEYDDVMNQQREVVYGYRNQILEGDELRDMIMDFSGETVDDIVDTVLEEKVSKDEWDIKSLNDNLSVRLGFTLGDEDLEEVSNIDDMTDLLDKRSKDLYSGKVETIGDELLSQFERFITLHTLDTLWKDHLLSMDHLKSGIGLRGYGQKNPLQEYKREGFQIFTEMISRLKGEVSERVFTVQIAEDSDVASLEESKGTGNVSNMVLGRGAVGGGAGAPVSPEASMSQQGSPEEAATKGQTIVKRPEEKIGRNDPCYCGSGKKFKKCHGK